MIEYHAKQGPLEVTLYFSTNDKKHHIVARNNGTLYTTNRKNVPDKVTVLPDQLDVEQFVQLEIKHGRI